MVLKAIVFAVLLMCIVEITANHGNPCFGVMDGYKNDFTDCRSYFKCVDEMEYHEKCPIEHYFNEELQICEVAELVECPRCPETGYLIYRHTNSCSAFTMCDNGVALTSDCGPGSYFHEFIRACFESRKVVCHICPSTGVAVIHNASNCRKYNVCDNGEKVGSFDCSPGSFFDRNTRTCVVAESCPLAATKPLL